MTSPKAYHKVVASLLNRSRPATILDAPSGTGSLRALLNYPCRIDGVDLFASRPPGYESFRTFDLNSGLPDDLGVYDAVVCCEGIEHIGNPDNFFRSVRGHLSVNGLLLVTTPNTWYPQSRLQYLLRGFFPSFPCLVGKIERGTHMHIMPWSFPQLYLYLKLCGFGSITLHDVDEPKPKRAIEQVLGLPQQLYCRSKMRKAASEEEQSFWRQAGSRQSIYGRRLVVSAVPI